MADHRSYSFTINGRIYTAEETQKNTFHIIHVNHKGEPMETGETGIAILKDGGDEWLWGEENISEHDKQEIMVSLMKAAYQDPT